MGFLPQFKNDRFVSDHRVSNESQDRWVGQLLQQHARCAARRSATVSPDGARVVTASADNSVRVWDAHSGRELATLHRHDGEVNSALFDASGQQILSVSHDGTAVLSRCDACRLALPALMQLASPGAKLAPGEAASLAAEANARSSVFKLPAW